MDCAGVTGSWPVSQIDLGRGSWARTSQLERNGGCGVLREVHVESWCGGESLTPRALPLGETVEIDYDPPLREPLRDK